MIAQREKFRNTTVFLDGSTFVGCSFERCIFVFSALMPTHLDGCTFEDCQWQFAGPAANTVGFMTAMYSQGGGAAKLIEGTFDNIRRNATGQRRLGDAVLLN